MEDNKSKSYFINAWPGGYHSYTFEGRGYDEASIVHACIEPFKDKSKNAVEIGPGRGFWSRHLLYRFNEVLLTDVIPFREVRNPLFKLKNYRWIEVGDKEYSMSSIDTDSVEFVFSFDVFCHFGLNARKEYLKAIKRILKPGGDAVVMFANWDKDVGRNKAEFNGKDYLHSPHGDWYYDDPKITKDSIEESGLQIVNLDMFHDANRDSIVHMTC